MYKSLGLIEVKGMLGAIEAADSALKAANVRLIDLEKIRGGIVTVKITGDVAAVKASVDAAVASVERLGLLLASHVIPRVHEETLKIIPKIVENPIEKIEEKKELEDIEEEREELLGEYKEHELLEMKVEDLRKLARQLKLSTMTNKQIKFGKKDELIKHILTFFQGG